MLVGGFAVAHQTLNLGEYGFFTESTCLHHHRETFHKKSNMPPLRNRARRHAIEEVVEMAEKNKIKSKPGPKPKPLAERRKKFAPPIKRQITTRPRERKLAILQYWHYALVPVNGQGDIGNAQEEHERILRHVTLAEVSERYKVPKSTISDWNKKENEILSMSKNGRSNQSTGICLYPEMEKQLYEKFCERREEGMMVRRIWFRLSSRLIFKEVYPELDHSQFRFSAGWFSGFLGRWGISLRVTTNKAQEVPENFKNLLVSWLRFNRRNSQVRSGDYKNEVGRMSLGHIGNMDQTPLPFEYLSGKTYAKKGDKTIWAKSLRSGWDKRQATLVLTVFGDGNGKVKPIIIFKGTADKEKQHRFYGEERKQYDSRVVVWFNPKGYCNTQTTVQWIKELLLPALHPSGPAMWAGGPSLLQKPQPSLLALDAASFHHSPEVLNLLKEKDIIPSLIPGGCTGLIQVLDVSVNKPFKDMLKNELDIVLDSMGEEALHALDDATDSAIGRRRILMTKAVGAAWERVCYYVST